MTFRKNLPFNLCSSTPWNFTLFGPQLNPRFSDAHTSLYLPRQYLFAQLRLKFFNGVAQHGARHPVMIFL